MTPARTQYVAALVLDLVGAGGVLLVSTRAWQTVVTTRPRPFRDDVLAVSGRVLDAAPTALAVAALAGVVAVVATRGWARRAVGAALLLCGAGCIWRSVADLREVSTDRARALVVAHHPGVQLGAAAPHVSTHAGWALLSAAGGLLVLAGGLLVLARGHRWATMSGRYEVPTPVPVPDSSGAARDGGPLRSGRSGPLGAHAVEGAAADEADPDPRDVEALARERWRSNATLWHALDRGDDPTA